MLGFKIDAAKHFFFDREAVTNAIGRASASAMSKIGSFIRRAARSSIRKRKKTSKPGQPPSSHTGMLREFIFFAYDPSRKSVVIGPAKTNQVYFGGDGQPTTGTVPEVLEFGGQIQVLEVLGRSGWKRADLRSRRRLAGRKTRLRRVNIAARPYMGAALAKERQNNKLAKAWANTVGASGGASSDLFQTSAGLLAA